LVSKSTLKEGISKFLSKDPETRWTNIPQRHSSVDEVVLEKIQRLQQTEELVRNLENASEKYSRLKLQIQKNIKKLIPFP